MEQLWNDLLSQMKMKQIDKNVSTAEIGDLIEFVYTWGGYSLWGVYVGEGCIIHFGVADENISMRLCRSFLQEMMRNGNRHLKKTKILRQHISEIKVPPGTRIRVNNGKHHLSPSPPDLMMHRCQTFLHQEFTYDLLNFNSEHFATFARYGRAMCNQIPFKKKDEEHVGTTQTLEMIMRNQMETNI